MADEKLNAFKEALKRASEKKNNVATKTDDEYFLEEFTKVNLNGETQLNSEEILPKLYSGLPPEDNELKQKLREEARAQFLQRRSRSLLDNEELKKLYSTLESHSSAPEENLVSLCEDNLMDYESFLKAKEQSSSQKCQQYFKVIIFIYFQKFKMPLKSKMSHLRFLMIFRIFYLRNDLVKSFTIYDFSH